MANSSSATLGAASPASGSTENAAAADTRLDARQVISFEPEQHPSKMIDDLLATAVRLHATDVHLEMRSTRVDVRMRLNGVMRFMQTPLNSQNIAHALSRIKVLAKMDIVEKRRPQDGSLEARYTAGEQSHPVTFRVSTMPTIWGESAAIRVLDPWHFDMRLEQIGMAPELLRVYRKLAAYPSGILLVTGPTGSGKTTTQYCTLRELEQRDDLKIASIEDPVEYHFDRICQTQVVDALPFAGALRAFLRQNADVLLVGEIRDAETAEVAIRAATTGHLILSTVHTKDAISSLARLRFLQVSDDYLSSTLIGVVAQRLVRKLCPHCKTLCTPAPELVASFYKSEPPKFFRGAGCGACQGTGFDGTTGLFELFAPDDEMLSRIAAGESVAELQRRAREKGFKPLLADALEKVASGVTSLEEIARRLPPTYL